MMHKNKRLLSLLLLIFSFIFMQLPYAQASGDEIVPERRKDQFPKEFAWYLIPLPYSFPGIGSGIMYIASVSNVKGTNTDLVATAVTGDVKGSYFSVEDIHFIPERLLVGLQSVDTDKLVIRNYETRGMNGAEDDYNFQNATNYTNYQAHATLSLLDRRLEFTLTYDKQELSVDSVKNKDGVLIASYAKPVKADYGRFSGNIRIDLTDDRQDPKRGVRFTMSSKNINNDSADDPDYYLINKGIEVYVPFAARHTWAINYFTSDAHVTSEGLTDRTLLATKVGLNCASGDTACQKAEDELINQYVNKNRYGTSTSLGGLDRLRAYNNERFKGAHTGYIGTELRFNLTEEFTPFNYLIWKDTRTGIQLALFGEVGSVSETQDNLWTERRTSYGGGIRMVTGSGFVYRFDIARGDEGILPIIWFYYPW